MSSSVIVTNHDVPEPDPLRQLREELDRELAVLRASAAGEKLRELFAASPQDIAEAANAAANEGK